jgi:hypothetical protein
MIEFIKSSVGQSVIWTTVLVALSIMAFYVVLKFRDHTVNDRQSSNEMFSNLREMREQGEITEAEFRTIKTKLGQGRKQGTQQRTDPSAVDGHSAAHGLGEEGSNESS